MVSEVPDETAGVLMQVTQALHRLMQQEPDRVLGTAWLADAAESARKLRRTE